MSSRADVRGAIALAFLAGLGISFVAAPLLLDSVSAGYDDGLLAGLWSAFLLLCLLAAGRDALDGVEGDSEDGPEPGMEERL